MPGEKLFVAPNALDTEEMVRVKQALTVADLEEFRRQLGITGKRIIVFCGRLMKRKRPDLLLHAMALVVRTIPQAHALIVGDGPWGGEMRRLCSALGLDHAVSFLGSVFEESTLARCFLASQAAVIPAAAGLNVQHAFAYGIPVIAGNDSRGHGPEIALVQHQVTGLLCRAEVPASFAQAIVELFTDEALRTRLGDNARNLVQQRYTLEFMADGFWAAVDYCARAKDLSGAG